MKFMFFDAALLAVVVVALESVAAAATAVKLNILFIVVEDLGWADVGWHGGFGKTPHLNRLVKEGGELDLGTRPAL
jgi:hypothetical protein